MWKKTAEQMGSQLEWCNGQAEQMNRVVQHVLRHYIKHNQNDWDEKLPVIASLYNNAILLEGIVHNVEGDVSKDHQGIDKVHASPTEAAILKWGLMIGMRFREMKQSILKVEPFNSTRKCSGVVMKLTDQSGVRVHWKGASEMILQMCEDCYDVESNRLEPLTNAKQQGYGQNFDAWAQAQTLEQFVQFVYNRWHDPQGAQKATDAINSLCARRYKNVRELTDSVEHLLVVPGVRYDQQVLLTDYLRCLPSEVWTKLVDEAYVDQHNFASFSKKALDIEAKSGSAHQSQGGGRKKRLPQDWKKKGQLMFVDHDGQATEIDDFPDLGEETEHDGANETSDGGVAAPIKEKARGTEKKKVVRSTGQGDQGTPAWVKLGLEYEVWRDRVARGTCMNCGNYGHTSRMCRGKKVTTRVASPTVVGLSSNSGGASASTSQGNTSGQ
ncbi:hypothetical protein CBR_g23227 [Chara braunii]|uniref:CCHC-type domain-containing protein n=1 Tax=Chara braunii TaxID=69332 RepID=A0A388JVG9_CHABU|nr:hypothetical protein CBR_g23227 [Chara braunii]|eukprot:GBG61712.1 hypothetical protein CBR_g23227 [Chara braunii]